MQLVLTEEEEGRAARGPESLMGLCREQAGLFDQYLRTCGVPEYAAGLVRWELDVCAGLLYQMYRGRLDPTGLPDRGEPADLPDSPG